jgi:hypothetical protein
MKTKYHKYFHWVALGGLCLAFSLNLNAQTLQGYTKTTKHVMRLLNKSDFANLSILDRLTLEAKTSQIKHEVFGTNETSPSSVKMTVLRSDVFNYMQLPTYTYTSNTVSTKIGNTTRTRNLVETANLNAFVPISMHHLFNYNTEAMLDSLEENNVSFTYTDDGTIHFWVGNSHSFINGNTLTTTRTNYDNENGNTLTKIMYQRFVGNKVYPVLESNQHIEILENNVKVLIEDEVRTTYTNLILINNGNAKIINEDESTIKFAKTKNVKVIRVHDALADEAKKESDACSTGEILSLYNMYGQKLKTISKRSDIDGLGLSNGIYKLLKQCKDKIITETIIINQ